MRRMGFSLNWPKLKQEELTTMRFKRRDKDWLVGETVMVVYQPRHFNHALGLATILKKETRAVSRVMVSPETPLVTEEEAVQDGFEHLGGLLQWLWKSGGKDRVMQETVNKLTIRWEYPARTREKIAHLERLLEAKRSEVAR